MQRYRLPVLALCLFLFAGFTYAQPWLQKYYETDVHPTYDQQLDAFYDYFGDTIGGKGSGWKQFKRLEWFMEDRVNENGYMNSRGLVEGWREWEKTFGPRNYHPDELDESAWTSIGPNLTQDSYVGGLGRLNEVAFHPSNPNIIYVGAASGGVWRTLNHGQTWTHLTEELPLLGVAEIVIDFEDPSIVYLASGDRDASDTYSLGVLKSLDGGLTWNETGLSYDVGDFGMVTGLQMSAEDPELLIATTNAGIHRSDDGGDTWTLEESGTGYKEIDAHPTDGDVFLACRTSGGIYRTTDGGLNWTELTDGLPGGGFSRITLDYSEADTDVIYALYSTGSTFLAVYYSDDGGDSWEQRANNPNLLGYNYEGDDNGGQAWYDLTIAADPNDANTVYTGGINIWKSSDAAFTFDISSHWWGDRTAYVHADQHCLDTNGDNVYAGHDGGIDYTSNGGSTWNDITDGLVITQSYRMGLFAGGEAPTHTLIGNQDNGTNMKRYGEWTSELGGDGMECAVHPTNPDTMYGEIYFGNMSRTFNGGQNWAGCNNGAGDGGPWVTAFVIDPDNPSTLYKATRRIYKTTNNASSWEDVSGHLDGNYLYSLALAPSNTSVVYTCGSGGNLFVSEDAGETWETRSTPRNNVSYLAVDPTDPETVYATVSGWDAGQKVYRSTNGGDTWTNISGEIPNLPALCIAVHPDNPDHLYVGMEIGVVFSPDGGDTWEDWSDGLPNTIVKELEIHQPSNTVVCCTYGRGMWQSPAEIPGADPTLQVLAPNGGEEYTQEAEVEIRWGGVSITGNVMLEVNYDYPDGAWETIVASTEDDGSYLWTIDGDITDNARVRVSTLSMDPEVSDVSNASFAIVAPSLTVVQPNGGETWYIGFPHDILWDSNGIVGSVDIELRRSAADPWETLFDDVENSGVVSWTPEGDVTDEALLRIRATEMNPIISDQSNTTFSLANPELAIIQPNGGETWHMGVTYAILFMDNLPEDIAIQLLRGGEPEHMIVGSAPSEFSYEWTIPNDFETGDAFTIKVRSTLHPDISSESAAPFTIDLVEPELVEPLDGEVLTEQPVHLEWTQSLGAANYTLQVALDSLFENLFINATVNQYDVDIQNLTEGSTYYWRVKSNNAVGSSSAWSEEWSFLTGLGVAEHQFVGVPEEYRLAAAYPNPFNPTCTVVIALPERARMKVQVFNIRGERVKTLASGPFPPGYHQFEFDAANLSSGTYFVRATVQNKLNEMKTIQLIR